MSSGLHRRNGSVLGSFPGPLRAGDRPEGRPGIAGQRLPDWRPYRGPRSLAEARRHQSVERWKATETWIFGARGTQFRARPGRPSSSCTSSRLGVTRHSCRRRRCIGRGDGRAASDALVGSADVGDGLRRADHGGADVRSCINAVYPTRRRGVRTNVRCIERLRYGPSVDGSRLSRDRVRCRAGRSSHLFGLRVRLTGAAGHNALRGSGPGQKLAFIDALAQVGCPDHRIDRFCITCCLPFPTITPRLSTRSRSSSLRPNGPAR
jgi:hypothetical protein